MYNIFLVISYPKPCSLLTAIIHNYIKIDKGKSVFTINTATSNCCSVKLENRAFDLRLVQTRPTFVDATLLALSERCVG
jgi:hypothetical protein